MRTVAEHREAIRELLAAARSREPVTRAVGDTSLLGAVLAVDLRSPIDHPPFDNSQMDGYAVRSAEVVPAREYTAAASIAAGQPVSDLPAGTVAPIMTGAPIPHGADAVIPIEAAVPDRFPSGAGPHTVAFRAPVDAGAFVRRRGSDLVRGELLLAAGTRLMPAQWGIIAASGLTDVAVLPALRVLVVSSGDELQRAGRPLASGQVYDANGVSMAMALAAAGAEPVVVDPVSDDAAGLRRLLAASAPDVDLVLTTGGVSAGAYEVVRDVLEPAGVRFGSVAMQPGGPQGWGTASLADAAGATFTVPVVAFPGNPVSALVSFEVFLAPALRELHGLPPRRAGRAPLAAELSSPPAKHQVRRGRLTGSGTVELVGGPSSHLLHGYASSTHLVHIPVGVSALAAGDEVEIWSIE